MDIPQDIIDSVIEAIEDDMHSLKQCSLVSSFLRPCQKQLFSRISISDCGHTCQRIHQLLVQNPDIRSSVRVITLTEDMSGLRKINEWANCSSLLAILRLPFCCLESFSIVVEGHDRWNRRTTDWDDSISGLKDVLSNIKQLSTVKTLSLEGITKVPITFKLYIDPFMTLKLHSLLRLPSDFSDENSSSLVASKGLAPVASHTVIDRCVWDYDGYWGNRRDHVPGVGSVLPFLCRLRIFELHIDLIYEHDLHILSFLIDTLRISLTSPATLEYLKFKFRFRDYTFSFNHLFCENLRDVWRNLDSIISHPTGSRLQRVDINIRHYMHFDDYEEDEKSIVDSLPLLRTKGILFVKAIY